MQTVLRITVLLVLLAAGGGAEAASSLLVRTRISVWVKSTDAVVALQPQTPEPQRIAALFTTVLLEELKPYSFFEWTPVGGAQPTTYVMCDLFGEGQQLRVTVTIHTREHPERSFNGLPWMPVLKSYELPIVLQDPTLETFRKYANDNVAEIARTSIVEPLIDELHEPIADQFFARGNAFTIPILHEYVATKRLVATTPAPSAESEGNRYLLKFCDEIPGGDDWGGGSKCRPMNQLTLQEISVDEMKRLEQANNQRGRQVLLDLGQIQAATTASR
jgi:hypothetical protein